MTNCLDCKHRIYKQAGEMKLCQWCYFKDADIDSLSADRVSGQAETLVMQGVSQPVFACAADRDLFIKNAGTWMDVDTFCETVNERDEFRTCKNCKNWQASLPTTIIACCDEANIATDGNFGCNRFASKQTA